MVKITKSEGMNKPVWLKYTEQEVKDIILNLIKKDAKLTSDKIGLILRDTYGIPKSKIYGIKVSKVLREAGVYTNNELTSVIKRVENIESHKAKHKHDAKAGRALIIRKARLAKIKRYLHIARK